ncbi:hypothetical protein PAP_07170 [Palaeococcus pacificus DY20341]|uniref:Uncharacterized protein n=1 Tax=Palaeococcus pacificus DY20341 TaxID=1343739 RepID=A0A075LTX4_9EURY|nr:hypothetical protein [Palaeococcus pacificus]AIF69824.1 hypothetical protein PAP_07170 [Palaeococcus pacificus DY20341]
MNVYLFIAIILGILVGITFPKIMEKYKYAGRISIMLLMAVSSLWYWKSGMIKSSYLFFEIFTWLSFDFVDYIEEKGIRALIAIVLIAIGTLGITLYEFEMTFIDILGILMSAGLALYGFIYLGFLVRPEEKEGRKV